MKITKFINRIFSTLSGKCSSATILPPSLNTKPKIPHKVFDDIFLEKFDEIIIIGDIHGCFDEFILLLDQINQNGKINSKRILKICAGDLINKGPKNRDVLEYFMHNQDDCFSVRGNHDQVMMNEYIRFIETGEIEEKNIWLKELTRKHFEYLKELPYTIRIPKLNSIIVHAGLVPNVPLEEQNFFDMIEMRNLIEKINDENGEKILIATKNDKLGDSWASIWQGPWHVYFGHDAKRKLQEHKYATGLDTGVVYGNNLTGKFIMGPRAGQYVTVKALKQWKPV